MIEHTPLQVAFIGLGTMGFPMAGHLSERGHRVVVYNRNPEKAVDWRNLHNGDVAATPAEAAANADIVMMCVGNDNDVKEVALGPQGALQGMSTDTILIDHTTTSEKVAIELAGACAKGGIAFLDAPVSGGQAGAENGQLTIMVGGEEDSLQRAMPALNCYAKRVERIGSTGSGQLAKMMNQICIAGVVQGLSEALYFGEQAGLDCEAVIRAISQGAAQSWQMENRYQTMLAGDFNFGFAVDWMRKDLGITLSAADAIDVSLPLTTLVDSFYGDVQAVGGGRWDTSSLIERLRRLDKR
ncbi:MAG: NAD(P)-dependent oxidoreductase [Luminiphilus sp.]|nr:NAD(P)-dependent oxidoreductase [Luminiphilus sp.]MDA0631222.1 NAD(P)-dependent oxidoreductase [Pseudomonadota bacterium]